MEDSSGSFNSRLQAAIRDKLTFINENVLGIIHDSIPDYRKTLESLTKGLLNAELLEKDLYESRSPVYELKQPPVDPIPADKTTAEISLRLFDYLKNFEYLENNCSFSPEELTIKRVISFKRFFSFINWDRLSPSAPSPNERAMAEIEYSVRTGNDTLLKGIFRDSKKQLAEHSYRILCGLEDIDVYMRESYKYEVRSRVLPALMIDPAAAAKRIDETVLRIKKQFKTEMGEQQFIPALIKEIIEEEYSENAESKRTETVRRLLLNNTSVKSSPPETEEKKENSNTDLLLEGLRLLSPAGPALISISEKLIYNADIIANAGTGFFQRLIQFLSGKKRLPQRVYDIVIFNAESETGSRTKIDINRLAAELTSTGRLLSSYGNKSSGNYRELLRGSGEELLNELSGNIRKLFVFQSKLTAIDLYMKDRSTNAMRASMRGIKLDLNDVQSCMFKANSRKAEYQPVLTPG